MNIYEWFVKSMLRFLVWLAGLLLVTYDLRPDLYSDLRGFVVNGFWYWLGATLLTVNAYIWRTDKLNDTPTQ